MRQNACYLFEMTIPIFWNSRQLTTKPDESAKAALGSLPSADAPLKDTAGKSCAAEAGRKVVGELI
jgi:hypothetical protein